MKVKSQEFSELDIGGRDTGFCVGEVVEYIVLDFLDLSRSPSNRELPLGPKQHCLLSQGWTTFLLTSVTILFSERAR